MLWLKVMPEIAAFMVFLDWGLISKGVMNIKMSLLGEVVATKKAIKTISLELVQPATQVFNLSSDGLGNKIIGTGYNCSGGTTPWGTILSAEENFQGSVGAFVGVTEPVTPNGTQTGYIDGTTGKTFGLVGEKYGWIVEIDPVNPNFRPRKHTSLGRFRHENVAIRAEAKKPLITYMGDDRRGGTPGNLSVQVLFLHQPAKPTAVCGKVVHCMSPVTIQMVRVNGYRYV